MKNILKVAADSSLYIGQPGNMLSIDAEVIPSTSFGDAAGVGLSLTINDEGGTEIYFRMNNNQVETLMAGLRDVIIEGENERIAALLQAFEFKSAQLSCAKGSVGSLQIVKVGAGERPGVPGFGFYDLHYIDDSGDEVVLHSVMNIECYVPFMEEEQYEWLRALVGGNHQFTSTIKIDLEGFTLEEIREETLRAIAARPEMQSQLDETHHHQ